MASRKNRILRVLIGFFCSLIGLSLFLLWLYSQMTILPGGNIHQTLPVYFGSIGIFLFFSGVFVIAWNKIANTTKQNKIWLGIFFVLLLVILSWFSYEDISYRDNYTPDPNIPDYILSTLGFEKDNNTLTIRYNVPITFYWDDMFLESGNATFPEGSIDKGDIITNCSGTVRLRWGPTNQYLGEWDFT